MRMEPLNALRQSNRRMPFAAPRPASNRAFSLIEILVAAAIVIVLIAIALPVMGRLRENAQKAQCVARLRTIGIGLSLYTGANGGKLPYGVYKGSYPGMVGWPSWEDFLLPNIVQGAVPMGSREPYKRTFECPSSPEGSETKNRIRSGGYDASYTYNTDVFLVAPVGYQPLMFSALQRPARTLLLACGSARPVIDWNNVDSPQTIGFGKHPAGANILFADGHVESVTGATINHAIATHFSGGRKVLR